MAERKLTTIAIAAIKKGKKVGKHADGGGLFLQVTEQGGFYWRYKYRLGGKEKLFSIGTLDDYSIGEAREEHEKARKIVLAGDDPVKARKDTKAEKEAAREAARPFREVAQEWYDAMIPADASHSTKDRYTRAIKNMSAGFGNKPITEVTVADLAGVLAVHEKNERFATRERDQGAAIQIGGYCVGRGYLKVNPFREAKFAAAFKSPTSVHEPRPAIVEAKDFGNLLRAIDQSGEKRLNRLALRILALIVVRPGELAQAKWSNIRWDECKMIVPAAILKQRTQRKKKRDDRAGKDFEVPLSRQAIAELRALQEITGDHEYLFPVRAYRKNKYPHQRTAVFNETLIRLGYQDTHCAHGFRSTFSTLMNEERVEVAGHLILRWPDQKALIEVQLDHNDASTQAIYDRGGHWRERCELMQLWADRVDAMRTPPKLRLVLDEAAAA